jgi:predicted N-acetyltransferase YhbS
VHRRSYADDPALCDRVFALLGTWLEALPEQRRLAERLDWRWEDTSTPFVVEEDGRVVSHVGLLEVSYSVLGKELRVGGIHAVCTLAERRRRGLYRSIMDELLDYCDTRYETLVLSTEDPYLYEPFGFRVVPEQQFVARVDAPGGGRGFRVLDARELEDLAVLERLLRERVPVSEVVGVVRERDVFKFNQAEGGVFYCGALDLVGVFESDGDRLVVRDLVFREPVPLARLLREWADPVREVVLQFSPDRFDVDTVAEPPPPDEGVFMVRGPFGAEGRAFMVPPTARH